MNILIVDDDRFVLEGIKKGIDWNAMPFEKVLMAQSVAEAKQILQSVPIGVLVSDIEMPQENGLALLRWIRQQQLELESIFLTCYADFNYAQQAVELGTFHYFLKPIEYEKLREIILSAAKKQKESESRRVGNTRAIRDSFWHKMVLHPDDAKKIVIPSGLSYHPDADFFFLLFFALFVPEQSPNWKDFQLEYAFGNMALELFSIPGICLESMVSERGDRYFLILKSSHPAQDEDRIVNAASRLMQEYSNHFHGEICCFRTRPAALGQMGEKISGIKASYPYIQTCLNRMVVWESFCPPQPRYEPPNLEEISIMLRAGNRQGIWRIVNRYLERLKQGGSASEEMLISFQYDIMQLIFSWLSEEQIEAHRLFANSDADVMMKAAPHSITAMQKYLFYLVDRAMDYSNLVKDNQSIAQRLLAYIDQHLGENISRSSLSDIFFLNPDYLARVFKQEMKVSISAYLLERRMERARYLLRETKTPINKIAEELGYENSSYFAKLFRTRYGMTPLEYRRRPGTPPQPSSKL